MGGRRISTDEHQRGAEPGERLGGRIPEPRRRAGHHDDPAGHRALRRAPGRSPGRGFHAGLEDDHGDLATRDRLVARVLPVVDLVERVPEPSVLAGFGGAGADRPAAAIEVDDGARIGT